MLLLRRRGVQLRVSVEQKSLQLLPLSHGVWAGKTSMVDVKPCRWNIFFLLLLFVIITCSCGSFLLQLSLGTASLVTAVGASGNPFPFSRLSNVPHEQNHGSKEDHPR